MKTADGEFVTFDVAVRKKTGGPAAVKRASSSSPPGENSWGAEAVSDDGNFNVANFGGQIPPEHPERLFSKAEYGVIRTYKWTASLCDRLVSIQYP